MILTDKELFQQGSSLIAPFEQNQVTNIGYDLKTECFFLDAKTSKTEVELAPGDTVFVRTVETISLPDDMAAAVQLKNSRIRQGLSLTAPIYQPGHKTKVFFRVTNITKKIIKLNLEKGIAYLLFLPLGESVEKPYNGTFQNEETFVGMGAYQSALGDDMIDIEKNVYGNVLSIMGIFIGIFSLINVNLSLVAASAGMATLLTFNFATVGAIAFLIGLINAILPDGKNHKLIWCASGLAFLASIVVQFIVK